MKRNNMSAASLVAKVREIWKDDVRLLDKMLHRRKDDTELYSFIDSLRLAKKELLAKLPYSNASNKDIPSPPTTIGLRVVKSRTDTAILDRAKLPKILCQIEKDQFQYIQDNLVGSGVPTGVRQKLDNVLSMYRSVVEQLDRAFKTQQLNPVVVR